MQRHSWVVMACLTFALAGSTRASASASTCTIGTNLSPSACLITSGDGLFTWTISDLHVAISNVNVTPAVLSLNATTSSVSGAGELQLITQATPSNHQPLVLDLSFDLSVTTTLISSGPAPPQNSEFQLYLDGLLLGTQASQGYVPGVPGVDGSFLNPETTIAVSDIFILGGNAGTNMFSESFALANPGDANQTPPSAPEPAGLALLGLAAILGCSLYRKLPLVAHHDLLEDRRKIVR